MNEIKFIKNSEENYTVELNKERYGALEWDQDQNAWVLWPLAINDGVTYFESLKETSAYIKDELAGNEERRFKIFNIDEEASSYFFTDENLKNEFNFYKSDKLAGFEANGKQIKLAYFAKYNAIATYERNKLNNIVFYMSAWQPETVREMFESRLNDKVFNLYQVNGVKIEKIY
ncbi:hypothetical protein [Lactobacillus johnsonii]|uniref:hypothetical protein n=1 Tax=Lactobacillus johnsonii TaxID=33959 RepID=UPI001FB445E1|nr:hypothetical protein [Lactobacillus johnsonii]UOC05455.1 hypothetical protein LC811_06375 [Lactobacillus johnsonii]